jgi:hypothetical protein
MIAMVPLLSREFVFIMFVIFDFACRTIGNWRKVNGL